MLIRPRRGVFFLPGVVPRLNPAHPAYGALEAAYLFGYGAPLRLLPGYGPLAVKSGTPSRSIGRPGAYADYNGSSGHQASTYPSGDVSIVVVAMRGITAGSAGSASMVPVVLTTADPSLTGASWRGMEIELGNDWSGTRDRMFVQIYPSGSGSVTAPNAIWIDGRRDSVGSLNSATDLVNGVWYCCGTTISNLPAGNTALTVGQFETGIFTLTGGIAAAFVCRGVLPDAIMAEWTASPADMLIWPGDDLSSLLRLSTNAWVETISDGVTVGESFSVSRSMSAAVSDAVTAADSLAVTMAGAASLSDAMTGADSLAVAMAAAAALSDGATLGEGMVPAMAAGLSLSDAVTAADSLTIVAVMAAALADSVTGADSFAVALMASTSLTDAVTLADAMVLGGALAPAPAARTLTWLGESRTLTWPDPGRSLIWRG